MNKETEGSMDRTTGKIGSNPGRFAGYPPRDRYFNDPQFKSLVDYMTSFLMDCDFTPSEMRMAAVLASIKYEEMNIRTHVIMRPELEEALATIRKYVTEG